MPELRWEIIADDKQILAELKKIEAAATQAGRAVQGIGKGMGAGASAGTASVKTATTAIDNLGKTSEKTSHAMGTLGGRIRTIGEGLLIYKGFSAIESTISHLAEAMIGLPAVFEQTQIAFTTLLGGSATAADTLLAKLQTLANVTPFHFADETAAARVLLGFGQAAEKVLPELVDIDSAVAAIGGNDAVVRDVADALGRMTSQGRVNARDMKSLVDNGIPGWNILAQSMGKSVEEVRQLSENSEIAASVFEKAFHTYVVDHWGDAVAKQSQTFAGLVSTAQDLFEQFTRVFGMPIIQELEPRLRGALAALQDPAVLATIQQWGQAVGQFVGQLLEGVSAVAQLLGMPLPTLTTSVQSAGDAVKQFQGDWSTTTDTVGNTKAQVKDLNGQIKQIELNLRGSQRALEDENAGYQHQSDAIREQIRLLDEKYARENRTRDIARLEAKIRADAALAVDIVSPQGQAAAKRLVDERAQLEDALRAQQHDTTKQGLEDQQAALEAGHKKRQDAKQATIRDQQETVDRLRQQVIDLQEKAASAGGAASKAFSTAFNGPYTVGGIIPDSVYATTVQTATAQAPKLLTGLLGTNADWNKLGGNLITGVAKGITDLIAGGLPILDKASAGMGDTFGTAFMNGIKGTGLGRFLTDIQKQDWTAALGELEADTGVSPDLRGKKQFVPHVGQQVHLGGGTPSYPGTSTGVPASPAPPPYNPPGGPGGTGLWDPFAPHRADGGATAPYGVYTVGERGPETLFMGASGGYVWPNASPPGGGGGGGRLAVELTVRTVTGEVVEIVRQIVTGPFIADQFGTFMRGGV